MYSSINEAIKIINNQDKIAAVDIGSKKIGIATCNISTKFAFPHSVIQRKYLEHDVKEILGFIQNEDIRLLVVGYPVESTGNKGKTCEIIDAFIAKLLELSPNFPVCTQDERFSTVAVNKLMKDISKTRKDTNKIDDKLAAAYILQIFVDRLSY